MGTHYSPALVHDGLIHCVDAKNIKSYSGSGTTVNDIAGTSSGTLTNATFNSNGYFTYDGTTDYITTNLSLPDGNATFSVWALNNNVNNWRPFIATTGTLNLFWFGVGANGQLRTHYGNTNYQDTANSIISANVWYNVVVTWNGSAPKFYVNGSLVSSSGNAGANLNSTRTVRIGNFAADGANWSGHMTQNNIYNRELSVTEILQNFNALRGRFGV